MGGKKEVIPHFLLIGFFKWEVRLRKFLKTGLADVKSRY